MRYQYSNYTFLFNYKLQLQLNQDECNKDETIHDDSSTSTLTPATLYFDIESDATDYVESEDDYDDDSTDDDLLVMSPEEKKIVSICLFSKIMREILMKKL